MRRPIAAAVAVVGGSAFGWLGAASGAQLPHAGQPATKRTPHCLVSKPTRGRVPRGVREMLGGRVPSNIRGAGRLWVLMPTFTPNSTPGWDQSGGYGAKTPWVLLGHGVLHIRGHQTDGRGTLRADIPIGYGTGTRIEPTGLIVSNPGCYRVVGRYGPAKVSFVYHAVFDDRGGG